MSDQPEKKQYGIGDEVILRVEEDFGYTDKSIKHVSTVVVGIDTDYVGNPTQYLCYVPPYLSVPDAFKIAHHHVKWYGTDPKYVGEQGTFINSSTPVTKHNPLPAGMKCTRCNEYVIGADDSQPKDSYRCRPCRENPYR